MGSVFAHPAHANSPLLIVAGGEDGEKDPLWWLSYLARLDHKFWVLPCVNHTEYPNFTAALFTAPAFSPFQKLPFNDI